MKLIEAVWLDEGQPQRLHLFERLYRIANDLDGMGRADQNGNLHSDAVDVRLAAERLAFYAQTLESIAANTCCEGCQEAARVAASALTGGATCDDCPPLEYPTDKTRCVECPRSSRPARYAQRESLAPSLLKALKAYVAGADRGRVTLKVDRAARAAIAAAEGAA